ncbi:MAG: formate--tetrahydrofolate ligase [Candidatus Thermoplasmatota archaeon]|nr:formate--tetrahydrofolate ligase [Candidatus Thermoplasmatota archaeon]
MNSELLDIFKIGRKLGLNDEYLEPYGRYMAKVSPALFRKSADLPKGKLVLVTAMNPTKEGEGKTTTTIGLAQALGKLGKNVAIAIREPSLGPCFGVKGGATGGGKSKVEPSDRINLLFTSDFPAVTAAHNLLSAMINNHIFHGNKLRIDPRNILWPRTIDMNDRSLRDIIVGAGDNSTGIMVKDRFVITPASEIMSILGLSESYDDLKKRLARIIVAMDYDGKPVYCSQLKAEGAMTALLVDALKPNIVQTTEGIPAFIHTGPFGNIAHGTSSIVADRIALSLADIVVTEAGFGSELGAQKFLDMVSVMGRLSVGAVVIVATIRSMKMNGGSRDPKSEDIEALARGSRNLLMHVNLIRKYGFEPVVALNRFPGDTEKEIKEIESILTEDKVKFSLSEVFGKGGEGGLELASMVIKALESDIEIKRTYIVSDKPKEKIEKICKRIYGAKSVIFTKKAQKDLETVRDLGLENFHICMAKTQYSVSDNPKLLGWPENFKVTVKEVRISNGAGFLVPMLGDIMTMPGLPVHPAAENVDISDEGEILNLF